MICVTAPLISGIFENNEGPLHSSSELRAFLSLPIECQLVLIRIDTRMLRYPLHNNLPPIFGSLRHSNANNANEISNCDMATLLMADLIRGTPFRNLFAGARAEGRSPRQSFRPG